MVGPYNNPQESYSFYTLPYCRSSANATNQFPLVALRGTHLIDTQIEIKYKSMHNFFFFFFISFKLPKGKGLHTFPSHNFPFQEI